jgi:GNAT superfamily N-acetyltransferase
MSGGGFASADAPDRRPPVPPVPEIRPARLADLAALPDVERAAGAPFRDIGMAAIADDLPPSLAELTRFVRSGSAWVCADDSGHPVAYLLVDVVDDAAHVEQVSVHPSWSRRGIGRALLAAAAAHARHRHLPALTLTTFRDVAWNAPYYARLGFTVVPDSDLGPGLRAIRRAEAANGLDRWPRVAMRRVVD